MRKILSSKKLAAVAVVAVAVTGTGVAYAYWTTTGDGAGTAGTKSSNGTVDLVATVPADLAPGEQQDFVISGSTTSPTDLRVGNIVTTVTAAEDEDCNPAWFSVADEQSAAVTVPHGDGTDPGASVDLATATLVFHNVLNTNQDACKNADMVLTFAADGVEAP